MKTKERWDCLMKQNAMIEEHLRFGKIIDAFEMVRSQKQFIEYLIETNKSNDERAR